MDTIGDRLLKRKRQRKQTKKGYAAVKKLTMMKYQDMKLWGKTMGTMTYLYFKCSL